jgi:hypothetical protein
MELATRYKNGLFLTPQTMVPFDTINGIPSLPTMSSMGRNDGQWSWLVIVCLGAWVA